MDQPLFNTLIIALFSGFLGSIIGAFGTAKATYYFNKKHRQELERKERENLTKALCIELSTLLNTYMQIIGKEIEAAANSNKPPLTGMVDSHQSYFKVYDNSANLLGLLDTEETEKVIKTYVNLKAFFDELIHYGKLTDRYEEVYSDPRRAEEREIIHVKMVNFFNYLRIRHFDVKKMTEETASILIN